MVKDMEKEDKEVRCVRDFYIWDRLLKAGFSIADVNKDKKFICPILGEKCTFKSVVYFLVEDGLDETIENIYKEIEEKKIGD